MSNQQLANKLRKPIIRKFKKRKVYSSFKDNIWGVDLADNSKRKPVKIWTDQGSEFYNTHFKKWLKGNNIEMYSAHNQGKCTVAEKIIRTLKNKISKHMAANSENFLF